MKSAQISWAVGLAVLAFAHGGGKKHDDLVPPPASTVETRKQDVHDCISQARADVSFGKPPLDEKAKEPLQGHRTEGFIRESLPVVDRNYIPTATKSLFVGSGLYGPANISDRYVLCLLNRGYSWKDAPKDHEHRAATAGPQK